MPVFADLAAMQARFEEADLRQLSDAANAGVIDELRVDQALARADATIKGYVSRRHADAEGLAGQALLTEIACDLAFADLWRSDPPDWVKDRRKAALAQLADISAGKITLDNGVEEVAPRPDQIFTSGPERQLGGGALRGY